MADLDPAGSRLVVGKRRAAYRRQRPVSAVIEGRHRAGARTVVRVAHEQLTGIRGTELAPERADPFGGEGRSRRGGQAPIATHHEAVEQGAVHPRADELRTVTVEEHLTWLRPVRQREGRAGDRL